MARAFGSYPKCHWFKSNYRYQGMRPSAAAQKAGVSRAGNSSSQHGPVVKRPKTPPFHGGNTSSNLVRVTKYTHRTLCVRCVYFITPNARDEPAAQYARQFDGAAEPGAQGTQCLGGPNLVRANFTKAAHYVCGAYIL